MFGPQQSSGVGGGVQGVQAHTQTFWSVKHPGKISENLGKIPENLGKFSENPGKNGYQHCLS